MNVNATNRVVSLETTVNVKKVAPEGRLRTVHRVKDRVVTFGVSLRRQANHAGWRQIVRKSRIVGVVRRTVLPPYISLIRLSVTMAPRSAGTESARAVFATSMVWKNVFSPKTRLLILTNCAKLPANSGISPRLAEARLRSRRCDTLVVLNDDRDLHVTTFMVTVTYSKSAVTLTPRARSHDLSGCCSINKVYTRFVNGLLSTGGLFFSWWSHSSSPWRALFAVVLCTRQALIHVCRQLFE